METSTLTFTNLQRVLGEWAEALKDQYINNLREHGRPTTKNTLVDTLESYVKVGDDSYKIMFRMQDYWKYIEHGTRPHFPPLDAIKEWIIVKPILPYPDSKGRIPSVNSLAYLIGRKISQFGTKGKPSLTNAINTTKQTFINDVRKAIAEDVTQSIRTEIKLALKPKKQVYRQD